MKVGRSQMPHCFPISSCEMKFKCNQNYNGKSLSLDIINPMLCKETSIYLHRFISPLTRFFIFFLFSLSQFSVSSECSQSQHPTNSYLAWTLDVFPYFPSLPTQFHHPFTQARQARCLPLSHLPPFCHTRVNFSKLASLICIQEFSAVFCI